MELAGKVALVTGSTSGIGRATAVELALRGAHVLVSGRSVARGRKVVEGLRAAGGKVDFLSGALDDPDQVRTLAVRAWAVGSGRVDILVNCAGVCRIATTRDTNPATYNEMFNINVRSAFFLVAELAPAMAARGEGAIVNVTGPVGKVAPPGLAAYSASKAALDQLTKAWAAEYGPSGVRVNAVAPGPTHTRGSQNLGEALESLTQLSPGGALASPEDVARAVAFMVGDGASLVQGITLPLETRGFAAP